MELEYKDICCEFCDPRLTGKRSWSVEDVYREACAEGIAEDYYIDKDGCLNAIADDPYCGTGPMKINYCPMCGRSLKVVSKLQQIEKDFEEK